MGLEYIYRNILMALNNKYATFLILMIFVNVDWLSSFTPKKDWLSSFTPKNCLPG